MRILHIVLFGVWLMLEGAAEHGQNRVSVSSNPKHVQTFNIGYRVKRTAEVWGHIPNKYLDTATLRSQFSANLETCKSECRNEAGCLAINQRSSGNKCELLSVTQISLQQDLVDMSNGYTYYDRYNSVTSAVYVALAAEVTTQETTTTTQQTTTTAPDTTTAITTTTTAQDTTTTPTTVQLSTTTQSTTLQTTTTQTTAQDTTTAPTTTSTAQDTTTSPSTVQKTTTMPTTTTLETSRSPITTTLMSTPGTTDSSTPTLCAQIVDAQVLKISTKTFIKMSSMHKLQNSIFQTKTVPFSSTVGCARICISTEGCMSFNLIKQSNQFLCELNTNSASSLSDSDLTFDSMAQHWVSLTCN